MGVVANIADEVVVLHNGKVMEAGSREDIFRRPGHPYLQALMIAAPRLSGAPKIQTGVGPAPAPPLLEIQGLSKAMPLMVLTRQRCWMLVLRYHAVHA